MSYFTDNGIGYGDDEFSASGEEVPELDNHYRRKGLMKPEELLQSRQYKIPVNANPGNNRNAFTYSDDRYQTQTMYDLGQQDRSGHYYDDGDYKYQHETTNGYHNGKDGRAYPMARKGCVKNAKRYRSGRDPVPFLDRGTRGLWQPNLNWDGAVYHPQERFVGGGLNNSVAWSDLLLLLFIIAMVIAVVCNGMKIRKLEEQITALHPPSL